LVAKILSNSYSKIQIEKLDDLILSGIIYIDQIEADFNNFVRDLKKKNLWIEFKGAINLIDVPLSSNKFILEYINSSGEITGNNCMLKEIAILIDSIKRLWKNPHYQNRSSRINESTYTHDLLINIMQFLSYGFEEYFWIRW